MAISYNLPIYETATPSSKARSDGMEGHREAAARRLWRSHTTIRKVVTGISSTIVISRLIIIYSPLDSCASGWLYRILDNNIIDNLLITY